MPPTDQGPSTSTITNGITLNRQNRAKQEPPIKNIKNINSHASARSSVQPHENTRKIFGANTLFPFSSRNPIEYLRNVVYRAQGAVFPLLPLPRAVGLAPTSAIYSSSVRELRGELKRGCQTSALSHSGAGRPSRSRLSSTRTIHRKYASEILCL